MKQKLSKRRRRALVRLRHALAAEKFLRWTVRELRLTRTYAIHNCREWHQWHALGCP